MKKAAYSYHVEPYKGVRTIVIEDLYDEKKPTLTVTNDIENVVAEICRLEKINPDDFFIVYKDTEGNWDGWDTRAGGSFVHLGENDCEKAIDKFMSIISRQKL